MSVAVAVRDNCAMRFLGVQFFGNDALACRDFANAVLASRGDRTTVLGSNPEDFTLWHLSDFDEIEGTFNDQNHYVLMSAIGVLADADSMEGE